MRKWLLLVKLQMTDKRLHHHLAVFILLYLGLEWIIFGTDVPKLQVCTLVHCDSSSELSLLPGPLWLGSCDKFWKGLWREIIHGPTSQERAANTLCPSWANRKSFIFLIWLKLQYVQQVKYLRCTSEPSISSSNMTHDWEVDPSCFIIPEKTEFTCHHSVT